MVLLEGLSVNCFPYQVPLTQPAQEMFAIPQDYEAIPSCLIPYSTIARGEAPVLCYFSPCILLNGLTSHFPRKNKLYVWLQIESSEGKWVWRHSFRTPKIPQFRGRSMQ